MKKALLPPLAVLAAVFAFALWNSSAMETHTTRWQGQLHQAETLAESGDWAGAESALRTSYDDWSRHQTYLHVVLEHAAVDDAEAMGADAVVGVRYTSASIMQGAAEITAYGTAVKIVEG